MPLAARTASADGPTLNTSTSLVATSRAQNARTSHGPAKSSSSTPSKAAMAMRTPRTVVPNADGMLAASIGLVGCYR